ncbi:hypothetical protein [Kribbella sp. CA-247076]|uniref:hypothetical protein n=1 Tax=Kribbella sp. CA-247076 TaxID=3239941 RepID=UPI003D948EF0
MRSRVFPPALPAALLTGVLALTACGQDSGDGGRPVPVGGDSGTTSSAPTTATSPSSTTTSRPATTAQPTAQPKAQVIIKAGNLASNPAVKGLVDSYPLYFRALVSKDDTILKKRFPSFFYADVSQGIADAQRNGWVMRPPGSVVVVGARSQPDGTVRVQTCRSQTTQYWDPKGRAWTVVTPKGSPEVIEMIKTGIGWLPYRLAPAKGVNCARVKYPA